ncbi:B2 bradykinin receptor-like [Mixophyes fleayi]|uniref:B2 bradykinin receptor-like n=1 Tax=Mixophyes fleayi TaxID=3061075 RepID=UPI003F4DFEBB
MNEAFNTTLSMLVQSTMHPDEECLDLEKFRWIFAYQPAYMWFIFVFGFIENLFVISVFLLHKNRCTVAEIYLGNMAAADLILVSGLPFWAIYISNKFYWPFGSFLCVTVNSLIQMNLFSSIYFLMMISIDRYLAFVKTMSFGRLRRAGCAKVNCAIIWVFALLVSLPKVVFRKVVFVPNFNTTVCLARPPSTDWHIATNIILNVVGFLIPVIVITFCTVQIIYVLRNNTMQQFKGDKNEKKATWLVLSVLLVFIVCWLPCHISAFIDTLDLYGLFGKCAVTPYNDIFNQISSYMGYSNSCINPLLYVMVGNQFRKKAREVYSLLLPTKYRPRQSSVQMESSDTTRISFSSEPNKRMIY